MRLTVHVPVHLDLGWSPLWTEQPGRSCWRNLVLSIRHSTFDLDFRIALQLPRIRFSTVVAPCLRGVFWCPGARSGCARRNFCIHTKRLHDVISFEERGGGKIREDTGRRQMGEMKGKIVRIGENGEGQQRWKRARE